MSTSAEVEATLARIESLPTLSAVAVQLLHMTADPACGARDLSRVIACDQSLAARVLAFARRAHLGAEVDSIDRAVLLLGLDAVRNLVLSLEIYETFAHRVENESRYFDRQGFWKHSLATACAARLLAEAGLGDPSGGAPAAGPAEEAFCCGLLHDLGKVALSACFPRSYDRIAERADVEAGNIAEAEVAILGIDHTLAGRRLAQHWHLPEAIAECIWLHHQGPEAIPPSLARAGLVRLVHAADFLARQMRIGYSGNHLLEDPQIVGWLEGRLAAGQLDRIRGELPELVEARAELIGLSHLTSKEVYQEALTRANEALARSNTRFLEVHRQLDLQSRGYRMLQAFGERLAAGSLHEEVCRAAAWAVRILEELPRLAFVAWSPHRPYVVLAAGGPTEAEVASDTLPRSTAGDPPALSPELEGWQPIPGLPPAMLERLTGLLGAAPREFLPLIDRGQVIGAVVSTGRVPGDMRPLLAVLGYWMRHWLRAADDRLASDRLNEELAGLNRRLTASQHHLARLRSLRMIAEMAAGAAHELNNPLAVISGRAQQLRLDLGDERLRRIADTIIEQAHRASAIVSELMEFAKPSPPNPTVWQLREMLEKVRRDYLQNQTFSESQFILEVSDDLPEVWADADQIRKLFDEVIRNAIEAMPEASQRRLMINCRADVADDQIVIRIEDRGTGMSPEVLEHAFDPFFSHRTAGRGRGLGLSRAARYVEVNGGRIRLASRPGEGTTVLIWLPTRGRATPGQIGGSGSADAPDRIATPLAGHQGTPPQPLASPRTTPS